LFNLQVLQQQTLNGPVSYSGIGLHSGNRVTMTFLPAAPNTGIRFRRVDLEGAPEIEARIENVAETNRSTTLAKGNTRVHTVEHVLATFAGCGVDNAIVELDANEPPVGDGSAREYCRMIERAGAAPQEQPRNPYAVTAPIQLKMGDSVMALFPDEGFKMTCTSADKEGRFTQHYSLELTPQTWQRELADARTFCFYEEIEFLIHNGLIKGGSLENAVVIREDAVLTNEPLRYPEEFVRHKMLDILGDFSLLGRPLHGHLIAIKPGHAANCELVRRIQAQMRKSFMGVPPSAAPRFAPRAQAQAGAPPAESGALDIYAVMELLPHRYPFLMVDRILKIDGNFITGLKNVTFNEPFFQGHFPGHPILPGVLQVEAIAQVAGVLMYKRVENAGKIAYFMSAQQVKWRKQVELRKIRGKIGKAKGVCKVQGEVVSEAEVTFILMDALA
jgi:UDP-3-O-[3-hydroxymyristoyl] N-acetylglucosamine deacetylase/3-hydroxyacyl-[acyl-carrier-protein] dehydratase